ncbi:MAG: hypothetical protein LBE82_06245 [Chitinophagaceae bacterium]|jgi:hypothetical protein|nr:hypothetical protein [Chitinophagaceae bacterium]
MNTIYITIYPGTTNKLRVVTVSNNMPGTLKVETEIEPFLIMENSAKYKLSDGFTINKTTKTIENGTIIEDLDYEENFIGE